MMTGVQLSAISDPLAAGFSITASIWQSHEARTVHQVGLL